MAGSDTTDPIAPLLGWREAALRAEEEISRAVVGQAAVIRLITIAVFARGHVLLQGDVGVGKTTLLRAFSRVIGGAFARVEGSVDLMPNDLIYYTYIGTDGRPAIDPGPLLMHGESLSILFFNEINRARPQVHALLLRAMAERSVRAFNRDHQFPHLSVFADRNRLEREETFDISSAALDRFMFEIAIDMPSDPAIQRDLIGDTRFHDVDLLLETVAPGLIDYTELNSVAAAIQLHTLARPALLNYALGLWQATRSPHTNGVALDGIDVARLMLAGASPRGMSMLLRAARVAAWLEGRDFVTPEDIQQIFAPVIAHRLVFQPLYEARRSEIALALTRAIIATVPGALSSGHEFHYEISWSPDGNRPGHHESTGRGSGFYFREHRPLMQDPDARRIDLHATLRDPFGDIKVRTFRERRAIALNILADVSASMSHGAKWSALTRFCSATARSAYRTGDAFGFQGASNSIVADLTVPASRSRGAGAVLESKLQAFSPVGDSSAGLVEAAQRLGRRRSLVFLVSDFHWPLAQVRTLLNGLAGHAVVPVVLWDPSEFSLPARTGWYEVRDLENRRQRTLWLRPGWRGIVMDRLRRRRSELQNLFLDAGTRPLTLDMDFDANRITEYFAGGGATNVAQ